MEIRIDIGTGKKLKSTTFNLPQAWDDVPAAIFPNLASLYLATESKMDKYDKTVRVFILLTADHWPVIKQLTDEELFGLLPLVNWVFDKLDLKKNLQPAIKIGEQEFIGPMDGMSNLRFGEWCVADTYLQAYAETEEIQFLHKLAAVLYRPAGNGPGATPGSPEYRGDRREKFNDQLVDDRAKLMAKLHLPILQGIFVFFSSCRKLITSQYPKVFPEPKEGEQPGSSNEGWIDTYDDLRGDPKYGGAEKLEEEFLDMVLFSLQRNNEKMEKLKEQYDI